MPASLPKSVLTAQAKFLGAEEKLYLSCTAGERGALKQRHLRKLKKEAKALGVDFSEYQAEKMKDFPLDSDVLPVSSYELQGDTKVYHAQGDTMALEEDPMKRDGPTVGHIQERERPVVTDLVGDRVPRTLTDLYARWPISQDSDFFLRIERTKPRRYQGFDVAGLVGEIRGQAISEAEIQRRYGGTEYKVTLYGPDPRGVADGEGNPIIKALTDSITVTVPVFPPNLTALPQLKEDSMMLNPSNPFGAAGAPTSSGDAVIHKANTGFLAEVFKSQQQDQSRREQETSKASSQLISFMSDTQRSQVEMLRAESVRREEELKKQLEEMKESLKAAKEEQNSVATQVAKTKDESNRSFMEFVTKMGPDKEAEIRRLQEYYREQLATIQRSQEEQTKSMRERHDGDLRRGDERVSDLERSYRTMLEQERTRSQQLLDTERSQWAQRERDLREQMKEQASAERESTNLRISEMKERLEAEMKQAERSHEREIRMLKESSDVKLTVTETTHKMSLAHAMERLEDAKADVERAREEAEEAKDLTGQLERAEKQAELLGYEKKDAGEPKTPWERLAATAGAGLSSLFTTAPEWLPAAMANRAEKQQQQVAMLQQQRAVQQQQQPQRVQRAPQQTAATQDGARPRSRGAQWASEGVRVQPTRSESEPLGFQPETPVQQSEMKPPVVSGGPQPSQVVQNPAENTVTEPTNGASTAFRFPEKFLSFFPQEALIGFLQQAEQAVNNQVQASGFSSLMVSTYPDGARALVENFKPSEITEVLGQIPGSENSSLLRREGQKWLEGLWKAIPIELRKKSPQVTTA